MEDVMCLEDVLQSIDELEELKGKIDDCINSLKVNGKLDATQTGFVRLLNI